MSIRSTYGTGRIRLKAFHDTSLAKVMQALGNEWIFEGTTTYDASKRNSIVIHGFDGPVLDVVSLPAHEAFQFLFFLVLLLLLLFLPLFFQFPPGHGITSIVEVYARISEPAKSRFLVILANVGLVVEPTGGADELGRPQRSRQEGVPRFLRKKGIVAVFGNRFLRMVLGEARYHVFLGEFWYFGGFELVHDVPLLVRFGVFSFFGFGNWSV